MSAAVSSWDCIVCVWCSCPLWPYLVNKGDISTSKVKKNKKQRHYFANKGPSSQSYGFSSSHVWMWELDYKESRALKK